MAATAPVRFSAADRRQQIMDVALQLFARRGFQGTTTRRIAERAHVNEAIIFRHFSTKEDLYWAVIEHKCRRPAGESLKDRLHQGGSDREIFSALAEEILDRRARDTTLSRLLLFTALENHRLSHRFFRTYVAEYFEILADHIRARIGEGRFREVNPLLAARGFIGMVVYHSWMQELFGWKRYEKFDHREVSQVLTDIWLKGIQPEDKSHPHNGSGRPNKMNVNGSAKRHFSASNTKGE